LNRRTIRAAPEDESAAVLAVRMIGSPNAETRKEASRCVDAQKERNSSNHMCNPDRSTKRPPEKLKLSAHRAASALDGWAEEVFECLGFLPLTESCDWKHRRPPVLLEISLGEDKS